MVTVTINIKPYLAGYMYVRYRQSLEPDPENQSHSSSPSSSKRLIPIHLSHITPVYHFLHQLSVPHPQNTSWKEIGNICFVLPKPRNGKNPEVYNYIGNDSALIIEKEIETEMKAELYSFLLDNKFNKGVMFKKSIEQFVEHYEMVGLVQEETLMRAFQRWRKLVKEEKAIKQYAYSLFINTQCFIIKTVEIDTSNFKNDSKNGDLTYLTFVLVFKMRSICAFLTMFVLRSISISLCL